MNVIQNRSKEFPFFSEYLIKNVLQTLRIS